MRILKYLFLLLLLAIFAASVFVATQRGSFDVTRSAIIHSPRMTVYTYVNDYRNWENFGSWKADDPSMQFTYPANTTGKGASYSWTGKNGAGSIKTISAVENTNLIQELRSDGSSATTRWTFSDTTSGTKVTWQTKGELGFLPKIYSTFRGGAQKVNESMIERSLENLDKSLEFELKTYNIKVAGMVKKLGTFYIGQRVNTKISNVSKNLRVMLPKLLYFFGKNKIKAYGRPFVIYNNYDEANDMTGMTVCVPVDKEILISPGSDVMSGKLEPFTSVKGKLSGDYSHRQEAREKTMAYMKQQNLPGNLPGMFVELFEVSSLQQRRPSKWVTDIYLPISIASATVTKKLVAAPASAEAPAETTPEISVPQP